METLTIHQSQPLVQWPVLLEEILTRYGKRLNLDGDVRVYVLVSRDGNHFMLMHEGWQGHVRLHGPIVHAEIRDGKIWVHYDGTEDGITDELVAAGVPKERIVLAFHPPDVRQHTGYGVA
jgi:hypothetical protein